MDRKEFEKLVKVDIAAIRFEKRECINVYEMGFVNLAEFGAFHLAEFVVISLGRHIFNAISLGRIYVLTLADMIQKSFHLADTNMYHFTWQTNDKYFCTWQTNDKRHSTWQTGKNTKFWLAYQLADKI